MKAAFLAAVTASAVFTRASVALKQDGSQVAADVPRYESGKFGQAVMVEEGTANLIPNPSTLTPSTMWTPGQASEITDLGSGVAGGVAHIYFQRTGTVGSDRRIFFGASSSDYNTTVDKTKTNIYTIEVKAGPATAVNTGVGVLLRGPAVNGTNAETSIFTINLSTGVISAAAPCTAYSSVLLEDGYYRASVVIPPSFWTGAGTTCLTDLFNLQWASAGTYEYYARRPQLEAKAYPTTFVDGTRAAEFLSFPAAGAVSPASGTIECWVYVSPDVKRVLPVGSTNPRIFQIDLASGSGTNGIILTHLYGGPTWRAGTYNDAGVGTFADFSSAGTGTGWHHFAVTWSPTLLCLYIDGARVASAPNPNLPTGFGASVKIGWRTSTDGFLNSLIDNIRCYNRALTSAEIANVYAGMTPSVADFTAWLAFDGDLSLRTPADTLVFSLSPLRPPRSLSFEQDRRESVGGIPCVRDYVIRNHILDLPLRLTTAEVSLFRTFWRSTVRGMSRPFTYIDVRGNALACRFAQPSLPDIVERAYDSHRTTVKLRAE